MIIHLTLRMGIFQRQVVVTSYVSFMKFFAKIIYRLKKSTFTKQFIIDSIKETVYQGTLHPLPKALFAVVLSHLLSFLYLQNSIEIDKAILWIKTMDRQILKLRDYYQPSFYIIYRNDFDGLHLSSDPVSTQQIPVV